MTIIDKIFNFLNKKEMTNQWKKYNKEETREVIIETIKTSEKEQKQIMEKLTNFIKKRAGMNFMFIVIFIIIMLLIGFLISYFK